MVRLSKDTPKSIRQAGSQAAGAPGEGVSIPRRPAVCGWRADGTGKATLQKLGAQVVVESFPNLGRAHYDYSINTASVRPHK